MMEQKTAENMQTYLYLCLTSFEHPWRRPPLKLLYISMLSSWYTLRVPELTMMQYRVLHGIFLSSLQFHSQQTPE